MEEESGTRIIEILNMVPVTKASVQIFDCMVYISASDSFTLMILALRYTSVLLTYLLNH